ncbi:MAG: DUF4376 domain-containing protein [Anaerolineales bacterium]|jgi:hypothetical protein|nr:DUF4376 domain-containing protein [Anaerolineales bacterium]|tara:strand:+ start:448 stop:1125 length:678 start_codon:yes stop_codon:yes gene_type:complete
MFCIYKNGSVERLFHGELKNETGTYPAAYLKSINKDDKAKLDVYLFTDHSKHGLTPYHTMGESIDAPPNETGEVIRTATPILKSLEVVKRYKNTLVTSYRQKTILNGIYWVDDSTTYVIDTSISSQSRLAHASIHGNETNITERKWSMTKEIETAEGIKWISERLTLPMSKFKQMVVAVVDHIDTCYDVEETHLAAIAALTTAQEVVDYDITPNWPSNPVHVELL